MHGINFLECFRPYGVVHVAMLLGVAAIVVKFARSGRFSAKAEQRFAVILFSICLIEFLYGLRPSQIGWSHSLPLHVCDIAGLMAAVAIQAGGRMPRCILHFWGLVLSPMAFLFPLLQAGPLHLAFWLYWINHGAIVVAAVYDLAARGYRPTWRDWRLATLALSIYSITIIPFDVIMHVDYGFLGQTGLAQRSIATAFGPWPQRLPVMWLTAIALMALLQLRWPKRRASVSLEELISISRGERREIIATVVHVRSHLAA